MTLVLVTSYRTPIHCQVFANTSEQPSLSKTIAAEHEGCFEIGQHAYLHTLRIDVDLPQDQWIYYDVGLEHDGSVHWLEHTGSWLRYEGSHRPGFVVKSHVDQILHGSCRKPHHDDVDAMLCVDQLLQQARIEGIDEQPAMLLFTGDQVYTDDVAGPHLSAISQLTKVLGLFDEVLPGDGAPSSQQLQEDPGYYQRSSLLPRRNRNNRLETILFSGARKPIFTSINAENHLLTLGEVLAQYLLCWSPVAWSLVEIDTVPAGLSDEHRTLYQDQLPLIRRFQSGLADVARVLANVPCYMIFDDHDITDDWNLSRAWEDSAYQQPTARRIIGNALVGYWLFQGWGNAPERFSRSMMREGKALFDSDATAARHDALITILLKFERWSYVIDCQPRVVVMDTRTQRWQSEYIASWPSGLMDWESLAETQQHLLGQSSVILVSPAPIFGVKLIEVVQRVATWCGLSLMIDAENWMAHRGAASTILNAFRHRNTPQHFVILSGDVHYAFAFDILLRRVENSPSIWQITSSGLCNSFPGRLLRWFDRLNRWLFASRSPLNWLTQRRRMRIRQRRPGNYRGRYRHQRLVNGSGVGRVRLSDLGEPICIEHVLAEGEAVEFLPGYESDWVH